MLSEPHLNGPKKATGQDSTLHSALAPSPSNTIWCARFIRFSKYTKAMPSAPTTCAILHISQRGGGADSPYSVSKIVIESPAVIGLTDGIHGWPDHSSNKKTLDGEKGLRLTQCRNASWLNCRLMDRGVSKFFVHVYVESSETDRPLQLIHRINPGASDEPKLP